MFERVMLVDDNDADLVYTEVVLGASGAAREVLCFDTAQAALAHLADASQPAVSLILLDINMPEMDGFAFLAAYATLRERLPQPAPAPVVMLTSSPEPADHERAMATPGVCGYLIKPLDAASITRLLAMVPPQG
jgi:CheY-like chemotaxis protein